MIRKLPIFLFLIFLLGGCQNSIKKDIQQNNPLDSLSVYLEFANNDSLSNEKRKNYTKKAFALIANDENDSLNRVNYFKISNRYFNMSAFEEYKKNTQLIIYRSKIARDTASLAKAYNYMSDYYIKKFMSDSAYTYISKAEKLYTSINDNLNIARALLNKAVMQHNESDLLGCERTVFDALKKLRYTDDDIMIYEAYNFLGIVYGELEEYKLSKEYYLKALTITEKNSIPPDSHLKAITLNNLGQLYRNLNRDKDAIVQYSIAIKEQNIFKDRPNVYATLIDNLAYSKFKKGDFTDLPELFFKALKIRDSLKIVPGIIVNKIHLSEYYAFKKDTFKSIRFANEAYKVANENNEKRALLDALKQLSNTDSKNAAKYSAEYFKINDSLKIAENKTRNKFARIEFETEEITIEKEKLQEQQKTMIYIGLGVFLIGVFVFVIRFQAAKNRELLLVQEQQKANEEIYQLMLNQQNKIEEVRQSEKKRIAQELHDGVLGKLFGTRMNLGVLNNKNDEKAVASRVVFIDELKTLEQEIREISHDLNSEKTAVFNNFVVMVTNFFETQKTVCTVAITFAIDPKIEWNWVDNMAKINFYRILQEAFQNINKHANAHNVSATFIKVNDLIQLDIKDDGVGFNYARKKKGIGLQNMNSRITNSGGNMQIVTEIGCGTLLKFELPLIAIQTINLIPNEKDNPVVNGR